MIPCNSGQTKTLIANKNYRKTAFLISFSENSVLPGAELPTQHYCCLSPFTATHNGPLLLFKKTFQSCGERQGIRKTWV